MNYTMAHFKAMAGNMEMTLVKNGNMYQVWLYDENGMAKKEFDTIDKAVAKFNELAGYMMKGLFSNETRKEILKA